MRVCLFEDSAVTGLEPVALTRPVFDLLCGQTNLGRKQSTYFGASQVGTLLRPHLAELYRTRQVEAPVNDRDWLLQQPVVLVNGRWLPPPPPPAPVAREPHVGLVEGQVAYAVLTPDHVRCCDLHALECCLDQWRESLPHVPAGGRLINHLWELVDLNGEQIRRDFDLLPQSRAGWRPSDFGLVGSADRLWIERTATLDPMVVADTTQGPVVIDRGATVHAFSRLEGPCYIGPYAQIFGAKIRAGTTLGPQCRIGGEVEASIVQGFSNKYHDGFLGHSYIGEWVNLAAGTHTSDLRNDYGEISVIVNGVRVETRRRKVGSFLGDHTKTALGALLNTGTTAGVFTHLLPTGSLLPKYVPSFCQVRFGKLVEQADFDQLLNTAEIVMGRRDRTLSNALAELYRHLFEESATTRRQAVRDAEQRFLRQSA